MTISLRTPPSRRLGRSVGLLASALILLLIVGGYLLYRGYRPVGGRISRLRAYWSDPQRNAAWAIRMGERCGDAPFIVPTDGYIGFFWGDSFRAGRVHQGLDIFGPTGPDGLGETPVVAAYDGYLTRAPDWRSAVIIRHPEDPLQAGRQIWTYYTHMADAEGDSFIHPDFPPGTSEKFIRAGTLLGYQGNYSGNSSNPTGMHLHFSIVRDDGSGNFMNELDIENTLDPTPYLGIESNGTRVGDSFSVCTERSG